MNNDIISNISLEFRYQDNLINKVEKFNEYQEITIHDDYEGVTKELTLITGHDDTVEKLNAIPMNAKLILKYDNKIMFVGYLQNRDWSYTSSGKEGIYHFKDFMWIIAASTVPKTIHIVGIEKIVEIVRKQLLEILDKNNIVLQINNKYANNFFYNDPLSKEEIENPDYNDETKEFASPTLTIYNKSNINGTVDIKELQPKVGTGVYQEVQRLLHLHNLHMRAGFNEDGEEILIIDSPNETEQDNYRLYSQFEGISGSEQYVEQIPIYVAYGHTSGDKDFKSQKAKAYMLNEFTAYKNGKIRPEILAFLTENNFDTSDIPYSEYLGRFESKYAPVVNYSVFDYHNIHSIKVLKNTIYAIMRRRQKDAIKIRVTITGFTLDDRLVVPDTILYVEYLDESFYVKSVINHISPSGCRSDLELIRQFTMSFANN